MRTAKDMKQRPTRESEDKHEPSVSPAELADLRRGIAEVKAGKARVLSAAELSKLLGSEDDDK
jgi:hypothetical protein